MSFYSSASLVPVYSFGENELFKQVNNPKGSWLRRFQAKFQSMASFAPPLFYGRGIVKSSFGFLPRRVPIYAVGEYCPILFPPIHFIPPILFSVNLKTLKRMKNKM